MLSLLITTIIVASDQITKMILSDILTLNHPITVIDNFFYITLCHNKGAAWSIFNNQVPLIAIITILIILGVIYYLIKNPKLNFYEKLGYSMILGGAISNLIDRLARGYVIDYLDVYIFNYDYPVFNVADMMVVIGAIIILIYNYTHKEKGKTS